VDEFAPQLSFLLNAHNDLLDEIAKYLRGAPALGLGSCGTLWATDPRSLMLRFHATNGGFRVTRAAAGRNNIVRVAISALAAFRRMQSLHTQILVDEGAGFAHCRHDVGSPAAAREGRRPAVCA